jgi:hypothetical protein
MKQQDMEAMLELIQQWQQQQQTDYDVNRPDSGNPPAPESYSNPPIPMTLLTKFLRSQEAPTREENKRANRKYIKNVSRFNSMIVTDRIQRKHEAKVTKGLICNKCDLCIHSECMG